MHCSKTASLFDHLVGEREQLVRYGQAERLGGLAIEDQLDFSWLFHRQVRWSASAQNLVHEGGRPAKIGGHTRTVGDEATLRSPLRVRKKRRLTRRPCKRHPTLALAVRQTCRRRCGTDQRTP